MFLEFTLWTNIILGMLIFETKFYYYVYFI